MNVDKIIKNDKLTTSKGFNIENILNSTILRVVVIVAASAAVTYGAYKLKDYYYKKKNDNSD